MGVKNPPGGKECYDCRGTGYPCRNTDDEIVCPYCGHTEKDVWEYSDEGTTTCDSCNKTFAFDSYATRTFSTRPVPCLNGAEHEWKSMAWAEYPEARRCRDCDKREYGTKQAGSGE